MIERTPGPWKLILHGDEKYPFPLSVNTENDEFWIARDGHVARLSDAHLIAAVPDLLEALEDIYGMIESCADVSTSPDSLPQMVKKQARAAIAKAKGEQS